MKLVSIVLLIVISILLCVSVLVAQIAYRIETSLLSYRYTSAMLDRIVDPLGDPETHRSTVQGAFRLIRRELPIRIPFELESHIVAASIQGFSKDWFLRTADRMLFSIQLVLNGREKNLLFPLSLGGFKNAFLSIARTEFDAQEYMEIEQGVRQIPSSIDLAEQIPEETRDKIIGVLGSSRFILILLQYVAPALFIFLCFIFRRIGSGFTAVGAALVAAGTAVAVIALGFDDQAAGAVAREIEVLVPDFLTWMDDGITALMQDLIKKLIPVSLMVAISGLVMVGIGVPLIIFKQDPEIRLGGYHS